MVLGMPVLMDHFQSTEPIFVLQLRTKNEMFLLVFIWMANKTNKLEIKKHLLQNNEKSFSKQKQYKNCSNQFIQPVGLFANWIEINSKTLQNKSSLEIWILQFFRCVQHGQQKTTRKTYIYKCTKKDCGGKNIFESFNVHGYRKSLLCSNHTSLHCSYIWHVCI